MIKPGRLTIELVPRTCWWSNVRNNVSTADWEKIKQYSRTKSGGKCEVCGGVGPKWPTEAHEVWDYTVDKDGTPVQTLVDIVALCPDCHSVKHIGLAFAQNRAEKALEHLCRVNGWDMELAESYAMEAFKIWEYRSEYAWTLDVSFLSLIGITPPPITDRDIA